MTSRNNYLSSNAILQVQKKIARINNNPTRVKGLTPAELDVAIKAGLINKKQVWFWTEAWQKLERQAERSQTFEFDSVDEAIAFLHKE